MNKQAQVCRKCGKWFKSPFGNMQVLPMNYDETLCPQCNNEIDNQDLSTPLMFSKTNNK